MKAHKWWEEDELPDGVQWRTLEHTGVVFPDDYTAHGVKLTYGGEPVDLTPAQEELATFYAQMPLDGPQLGDASVAPRFNKNFFADFRAALGKGHVVKDFEQCGWDALRAEVLKQREARKARSKEEKEADKAVRDALVLKHGFALVDGHVQRVGNFTIEPPGLFRGRGQHPKTGTVKQRVPAERITINTSDLGPVPPCPAPGHAWKAVVHDPTVTWLAYWKENVMRAQKYVYLAASSGFKGKSDRDKYEKARKLKAYIGKVREHYTAALPSKDPFEAQAGTAMWVIDRLALRVGGEKDDDEADTVGCCSLRVEHITFGEPPPEDAEGDDEGASQTPSTPAAAAAAATAAATAAGDGEDRRITLDFLGKDSMRYFQTIDLARYGGVGAQVFKNLKRFAKGKDGAAELFDKLTPSSLNSELQKLMPGLSAKVFRTYNASITLQEELPWDLPISATDAEKAVEYNRANREVSILCNHQRTVPKSFAATFGKLQDRVALLTKQVAELRKHLKARKAGKDIKLKSVVIPKGTKPTEKQKAKRAAESHLFSKQPSPETLSKRIATFEQRLRKSKLDMKNKDDNKTVALGTAKINYMDPRITVAWCKHVECPIEKVFPRALRDKFPWACGEKSTWKF